MSSIVTVSPSPTATPSSFSEPLPDMFVTLMPANASSGASFGSLKPKSAATKTSAVSSFVVMVALGAAGASLTDVTSNVMAFADGSTSTPPLMVPPSSRTWKSKLA